MLVAMVRLSNGCYFDIDMMLKSNSNDLRIKANNNLMARKRYVPHSEVHLRHLPLNMEHWCYQTHSQ